MFDPLVERVLTRTLDIQRIPAPTLDEAERAAFIAQCWEAEGLTPWRDEVGNVLVQVPGRGEAPPLVVTAHMDTVFDRDTPLDVRKYDDCWCGPGIGDNSLGVAALFGLYWRIQKQNRTLPGDLILVANVAEEGLGGLKGMRALVDRFQNRVLAYIVLEGLALGKVYHRGLGVRRYRVHIRTPGGHAWGAYGTPSAIHVAGHMMAKWSRWILPQHPKTTMNVGRIQGGRGVNVIADWAEMWVEWRSEDPVLLDTWCRRFEDVCRQYNRGQVRVSWEIVDERPAGSLPAQHPLVQAALQSARRYGIEAELAVGSTDANIPLSRGYPAITVGLTTGTGAHTLNECIHLEPLPKGLAALWDLVLERVWHTKTRG